jgi:hypothetical protein
VLSGRDSSELHRRILLGLAFVALAAYGVVLVHYASRSAAAADISGYLNHAKALARGELVRPIRAAARLGLDDVPPLVLVPLGFVNGPRSGTMVPLYPPGLPLHMAAFAALAGWDTGPFLVSPLFAVLGLVAFYLLARELALSRFEALAGALVLALQPAYVFLSLLAMSDIVSSTWVTLAVLAALRARRQPNWAIASGAAFAVACLVRPTNGLLLLPLALAVPWVPAVLLRFALGAAPGFAFLLGFNQLAHGHPLRTGYGEVGGQFSLGFFRERWNFYTHWLGKTFTPLVPLAWLGVVASRNTSWRDRLLLLVWFGTYFVFFCFYFHHDAWWYLRFLLPGFPPLIVGAILAARWCWHELELRLRLARLGWTSLNLVPILVLALVLGREVSVGVSKQLFDMAESETIYPRACRYAAERLPARSIVLSFLMSGVLEYYTDLPYLRFDTMERRMAKRILRRTQAQGYRWYALVHPLELDTFQHRDLGQWKQIAAPANALLFELDPESLLQPIP